MDYGALAGAVGQFVGNSMGAISQLASTGMNNVAQMMLSKYQYQQEKQMIQEQNEYNSPKAQMERYIEAGLNPNLIYGEGKASAGQQQGIARYQAPNLQPLDFSGFHNLLGSALQVAMQKEQIEGQRRENEIKKEQDLYLRSQRMMQEMKNLESATILGIDPGLVWSQQDRDSIKESVGFQKHVAELQGLEDLAYMRRTAARMNELNAQEKEFYINNIQDIERNILSLQYQNLSLDEEMKELDRQYYELEKRVNITSTPPRAVMAFSSALADRIRNGDLANGIRGYYQTLKKRVDELIARIRK